MADMLACILDTDFYLISLRIQFQFTSFPNAWAHHFDSKNETKQRSEYKFSLGKYL